MRIFNKLVFAALVVSTVPVFGWYPQPHRKIVVHHRIPAPTHYYPPRYVQPGPNIPGIFSAAALAAFFACGGQFVPVDPYGYPYPAYYPWWPRY